MPVTPISLDGYQRELPTMGQILSRHIRAVLLKPAGMTFVHLDTRMAEGPLASLVRISTPKLIENYAKDLNLRA